MKNLKKISLAYFVLLAAVIFCTFGLSACVMKITPSKNGGKQNATATLSDDELYDMAVRDAVFAEEKDIYPLVNIVKDDPDVIWKGDKVLVTFLHKYPDSYPAGEEITLQWGNVWCVSAGENYRWIKENGDGVTDWTKRLLQVMGMPLWKASTTVTAMWVDASLLHRPAYVADPAAPMQTTLVKTGDQEFDDTFKAWFDDNILWSYFESNFPWTRLGYTYDWADNGTAYGLSEFLIFSGAKATIEYTYSIDDFAEYVKNL